MAAEYSTRGTYSEICIVPGSEPSIYHQTADPRDRILVTDNCLAERRFDTVVVLHCGWLRLHAVDKTLTMSIFLHTIGDVGFNDLSGP